MSTPAMPAEPTISFEDAKTLCAIVWPDRAIAEKMAGVLEMAVWLVECRIDARLGEDLVIVATIHHPWNLESSACPGDIVYRAGGDDACGPGVRPVSDRLVSDQGHEWYARPAGE